MFVISSAWVRGVLRGSEGWMDGWVGWKAYGVRGDSARGWPLEKKELKMQGCFSLFVAQHSICLELRERF